MTRIPVFDKERSKNGTFRARRFERYVRPLMDACLARSGSCSILDIGGVEEYWNNVVIGEGIRITIVNSDESAVSASKNIVSVVADGRNLGQFQDMSFDVVHSNSVIEHVGRWADMKAFASEVRRLAPAYYVQTPNYWFPVDPHTRMPLVHFLPINARYYLHSTMRLGWYPRATTLDEAIGHAEDASMLDKRQMRALFPEASIHEEKLWGLTKSIVAVRRACST